MRQVSGTVLFVDDDSSLRDGLSRAFWSRSHRVLTAAAAAEALEILRGNHVHVIVVDQQMPRMTGVELLEIVSERHPDTARILLTGNATLSVALRAINEGRVCRVLTKPCPIETLVHAINEAIELVELSSATMTLLTAVQAGDRVKAQTRSVPSEDGLVPPARKHGLVPAGDENFSAKEREILGLLAGGGGTADIAKRLLVSPQTVRNHFKVMFRKAGVQSQAELMALISRTR
jgi:DNA-binding NarL/FixJ family response regulator